MLLNESLSFVLFPLQTLEEVFLKLCKRQEEEKALDCGDGTTVVRASDFIVELSHQIDNKLSCDLLNHI